MLGIRLMGVGECQSEIPLFWRETHTKGLCVKFPTRPEEAKGRKLPEQSREETSWLERAGDC